MIGAISSRIHIVAYSRETNKRIGLRYFNEIDRQGLTDVAYV